MSVIPGWTLETPEERLSIGSANFLRRLVTTGTVHTYREGPFVTGIQRAGMRLTSSGLSSPGIRVFGEYSGTYNGYIMYASNSTTFAFRRYNSNSPTTVGTVTVATIAGEWSVEAIDTGSTTELRCYDASGVQVGSTAVDSSASRFVGGYNGIYLEGSTVASTNLGDDFRGNMQF